MIEVVPFIEKTGGPVFTTLIIIAWWVDHYFLSKKDFKEIEEAKSQEVDNLKEIAIHLEKIASNIPS